MIKKEINTSPYKGVRDFYPDDMAVLNYFMAVWRKVCHSFGYDEYGASILEPTDLYRAKTGDEIVNEQTYSFTDRGDREVTLRPEMTPTIARMIAGRQRELGYPVRMFSMPNLFRYEREQRGRLREHWQLNVDCFGSGNAYEDKEVLEMADAIMKAFQAPAGSYEIRISNFTLLPSYVRSFINDESLVTQVIKLIDRYPKIGKDEYLERAKTLLEGIDCDPLVLIDSDAILKFVENTPEYKDLTGLQSMLKTSGIDVVISPLLTRGFDYYSGLVFEVFDTDPQNSRSMFGGGRYNNLLEIFNTKPVPAIGFGMGDVTLKNFLETRGLLPAFNSSAKVCLGTESEGGLPKLEVLAKALRDASINVSVDYSLRKLSDQRKASKKRGTHLFVVFDSDKSDCPYTIQELNADSVKDISSLETIENVVDFFKKQE